MTGPERNYGSFYANGLKVRATHFAYEMHYGAIPQGLLVCHKCDNPPCVRPDHLFLGTHADNSQDASRKGRTLFQKKPEFNLRGVEVKMAKLNDDVVRQMRNIFTQGGISTAKLGKQFGVCQRTAWKVVNHVGWAHVI